jgi:AraC family transcriptional activator of pobA
MPRKSTSIPVNAMANEFGAGISVEKFLMKDLQALGKATLEEVSSAHRHDSHSFFLLESGTVDIEIDFQHYVIAPKSIIYIHPNQVHRTTASANVVVSTWALTNENLNPGYLALLEDITPAKPLRLNDDTFLMICEAASTALKLVERKADKLYHEQLKDSCNALVGLAISRYLEGTSSPEKSSRFETVTKNFRHLLERNYTVAKRPAYYAAKLNLSIPYLNECVKQVTGYPVTHHIQQRVVLEAKRLLTHSGRSVKEIAAALGYDDYPYFSRLFTRVTGITALAFRSKNLG